MTAVETLLQTYVKTPVLREQVQLGDKIISYIRAGSGPSILLLHGANIGWIQWCPNIDALAEHFTVYALDLPGCGMSSSLKYLKADFQRDYCDVIKKFIEQVMGEKCYAIIGHSFSGWIAIQLTLGRKIAEKIILVNPVGFTRHIRPGHYPLSFPTLAKILTRTVMLPNEKNMKGFFLSVFHKPEIDPIFVDAYCAMISLERHPFLFISSLLHHFRLKKELALSDTPQHISSKTFLIHSEYDPFLRSSDFQDIKHRFAHFTTLQIKNSGHVPSIEDAGQFNQHVLQFLRDL